MRRHASGGKGDSVLTSGELGREQSAGVGICPHDHTPVTVHAIWQKSGVPYEIHRTVCGACMQMLEEQPLRRAVA